MSISGSTRMLALLGHPVAHSLSPRIHNAAFTALGLNLVYVAFDIESASLPYAVRGLQALGSPGANVTVPHKQAVAPLLDRLDGVAAQLRTVNTIVNRGGRLIGYNTDVEGFIRALRQGFSGSFGDSSFLVLGAGGAGRAVVAALVAESAGHVVIFNRTEEKARALAKEALDWIGEDGTSVEAVADQGLPECMAAADVVVHTTSVGLQPGLKELPFPVDTLSDSHTVMDLAYDTKPTLFLEHARERGAHLIPGAHMLLEQAALSFGLWTGKEAPMAAMKKALGQV